MKTPATYNINSISHPSLNHQNKLEHQEAKQAEIEYLGLIKLVNKLGLFEKFLTNSSDKES